MEDFKMSPNSKFKVLYITGIVEYCPNKLCLTINNLNTAYLKTKRAGYAYT